MIGLACVLAVLTLPCQADPVEIYTKVANGFAVHMGPIGVEIFALERLAACGEQVDQAEVQALLAQEVAARAQIVGALQGDDLQLAYHYLEGMTLLSQNQRLELVDTLDCP
ncbi:MAG: hypothetical protein AAGA78_03150 [Pseudomonadota bacterium]